MTDYLKMPDELPEKPTGWTKSMSCHLNYGSKQGAGTYTVCNDKGQEMPMGWQYEHLKKSHTEGFTLPGVKPLMTWKELRQIWPRWIERARKKQREKACPT